MGGSIRAVRDTAETTRTKTLPDSCAPEVRAPNCFHGGPEIVVPDNLRPPIRRVHRFVPDAHPTYTNLDEHYGLGSFPGELSHSTLELGTYHHFTPESLLPSIALPT